MGLFLFFTNLTVKNDLHISKIIFHKSAKKLSKSLLMSCVILSQKYFRYTICAYELDWTMTVIPHNPLGDLSIFCMSGDGCSDRGEYGRE